MTTDWQQKSRRSVQYNLMAQLSTILLVFYKNKKKNKKNTMYTKSRINEKKWGKAFQHDLKVLFFAIKNTIQFMCILLWHFLLQIRNFSYNKTAEKSLQSTSLMGSYLQ